MKVRLATLVLAVSMSMSFSALAVDSDLPRKDLTPGKVDLHVTQSNIHSTICVKGYTSTVRPPVSYTNKLKRQQIIQYGYTDRDPTHYEEDHLVSLELGGHPTDPKNLWPQPYASCGARVKDYLENTLHRQVCSGKVQLRVAQTAIATNWKTAYKKYMGKEACK